MGTETPVEDVMIDTFVQAPVTATAREVLDQMAKRTAEYAVAFASANAPVALLTRMQLRLYPPGRTLEAALSESSPPILVEPGTQLGALGLTLRQTLALDPAIAGVIVVEQDQVVGVVPRAELTAQAKGTTRGGESFRLAGDPLTALPVFECPVHKIRKVVIFFNPANPPRCPQGDQMQLVK